MRSKPVIACAAALLAAGCSLIPLDSDLKLIDSGYSLNFDPVDLRFVGPLEFGRKAGYAVGFLIFRGLAAGSSALTCFLERNRARR